MRVAMTLSAVLEIANAFPQMLCPNSVGLVRVASIAGVAAGIAADMAGCAGRVVRALQLEELSMVEIGPFPACQAVALRAIGGDISVDGGAWHAWHCPCTAGSSNSWENDCRFPSIRVAP